MQHATVDAEAATFGVVSPPLTISASVHSGSSTLPSRKERLRITAATECGRVSAGKQRWRLVTWVPVQKRHRSGLFCLARSAASCDFEHLTKPRRNLCIMCEKLLYWGLLPRVRVPKIRTTEAQRERRRGATSASVPSVPLWFKRLDKNAVLLGDLGTPFQKKTSQRIVLPVKQRGELRPCNLSQRAQRGRTGWA